MPPTSGRTDSPLKHKSHASAESKPCLRQPIERLPQEIVAQIAIYLLVEEQILFGLSSTAIYQQIPSQLYRKICMLPRPTHEAYEEYVKHLGKLWNTCTPGTTSKDYFSSRVIERILQVLSGWMTPWACQEQKPFTMPQFIRLHLLVEKSLSMQETATEFVNFFLRNEGPFTPCQKWRVCSISVPYEDNYSYSNKVAYIKMRELVMSHNLFANPEDGYAHPLHKCMSCVVCTVIQYNKRTHEDLEKAVQELERALVDFKNLRSRHRKSGYLDF